MVPDNPREVIKKLYPAANREIKFRNKVSREISQAYLMSF